MRDDTFGQESLVLPAGNGPGTGRIVLGSAIPIDLENEYANIVAAILWYYGDVDDDTYHYYALSDFAGTGLTARGDVINGVVHQLEAMSVPSLDWDITRSQIMDGKYAPRAMRGWAFRNSASPFVGAAESEVLRINSVAFLPGRAYRIEYEADVEGDTANNSAEFKLYSQIFGVSNQLVRFGSSHPMASVVGIGSTCPGSATVVNTGGTTKTREVIMTLAALVAGQVRIAASGDRLTFLRAYDIGAASEFAGATVLA